MGDHIHISIIFPVTIPDQLEQIRQKYDRFAKYGVPTHVTFIYKIKMEAYEKNEQMILFIVKNIVKRLKKYKLKVDHIVKNDHLFALGLPEKTVKLLNSLQNALCSLLEFKNSKYSNDAFKPHITLFSGNRNKGWKKIRKIENVVEKGLPFEIELKEGKIMRIDTKQNKPTVLHTIM